MKELWRKEKGRHEAPSVTRFPGLVLFVEEGQGKQPGRMEPAIISANEKAKMPVSNLPPTSVAATIPSVTSSANNGNVNVNISSRNNTTDDKGFWQKTPWTHWVTGFTAFLVVMGSLCLWVALANESMKQLAFDENLYKGDVMDGFAMDNPDFLEYLRNVQLQETTHQYTLNASQTLEENYVATLLDGKQDGVYFEYISKVNVISTTAWLESNLNWRGVLMLTDPPSFFQAKKGSRNTKSRVIHAGLSTDKHTKELPYHQEEEVRVTKLASGPNSLDFNDVGSSTSRLKYFPLYSVLLAYNATTLDYMSLHGSEGQDNTWIQQILDTVPWDIVRTTILSIHWGSHHTELETKNLTDKLASHNYKSVKTLDNGKMLFVYNRRLKI